MRYSPIQIVKAAAVVVVVLMVLACGFLYRKLRSQGVDDSFWRQYPTATVRMDAQGIPTIEGKAWDQVFEAQGYVVASARLWQMDLIRRKAAGRLAEWFGADAFEHDKKMRLQGRSDAVQSAFVELPDDERKTCELFAKGVNAYIREHVGRWGAEYFLLRAEPEVWTCQDSLYVLLEMSDILTSSMDLEIKTEVWRRNLSLAWQQFLFPLDHPWNKPLFGKPPRSGPLFPPPSEYLAARPLQSVELGAARSAVAAPIVGSNNWSWRGPTGVFLANDPHLGSGVPGIWYAMRLRVNANDWVVGSTLPGMPGIVIGMNPGIAWAFTNSAEDVDDLLMETITDDGSRYVERLEEQQPVWAPIVKRSYSIKVKGEAKPREVQGPFTHRGPLVTIPLLGSGFYSRQWLPLKKGMLRLPTRRLIGVRTFEQFNSVIDSMKVPSQNVLFADRAGGLGYRMSGTGVIRGIFGMRPQPAMVGEWQGFESQDQRLRAYFPPSNDSVPKYLATANERVWVDPNGGAWASDDRKDRIDKLLAASSTLSRSDMQEMQLDTIGRFRRVLMDWLVERATPHNESERLLLQQWRGWDGDSRSNSRIFAQSTLVEDRLMAILTGRISERFPAQDRDTRYQWPMDRAWLLAVLEAPGDAGVLPFGLTATDVANSLVKHVSGRVSTLRAHESVNRWAARHPFVGRMPFANLLFGVDEPLQWGAHDLVRAESPKFGPSMRMVWDMREPQGSTWIFPVGQSSHSASPHFNDLQKVWAAGGTLPVFEDGLSWHFD